MDELLTGERKVNTGGGALVVDNGKNLYRTDLKFTCLLEDKAVVFFEFDHQVSRTYFTGSVNAMFFDFKSAKDCMLKSYPRQETKSNTSNSTETFSMIPFVKNNKIHLMYNVAREVQISADGQYTDQLLYPETKENKAYFLCKTMAVINSREVFILSTEGSATPDFMDYKVSKLVFKE